MYLRPSGARVNDEWVANKDAGFLKKLTQGSSIEVVVIFLREGSVSSYPSADIKIGDHDWLEVNTSCIEEKVRDDTNNTRRSIEYLQNRIVMHDNLIASDVHHRNEDGHTLITMMTIISFL